MNPNSGRAKLLVIAADDLGRSSSVNDAIFDAYDNGILTSASIMAGGGAFKAAVSEAKKRGAFSLGLHVTLCDGKAVLPHSCIPDLTAGDGSFVHSPASVWLKLGNKKFMAQAEAEVGAQFDRLEASGLKACYVDAHHHLHMHPGLFNVVCRAAAERGLSWIRLPCEPLSAVARLGSAARGMMPFVEWAVFGILKTANARTAKKYGLGFASNVYGLSGTGDMNESRVISLLEHMASAEDAFINEIFFHPDSATESGTTELSALKSQNVMSRLDSFGIKLIGYNVNNDVF